MGNIHNNIQNTQANLDFGFDWQNAQFSHPERTVRVATSFSGIGAIEHAFHRLGLKAKIQFAGDIDADCKKSYFANYDISEARWHNDISEFDATPYKGQVDLFVGGAPCQAFSQRGKRGGFDDTRGTLFREFARVVIECQPKVFIFENVKGLLNHDKGNTWKVMKDTFEKDCGYQIYYQVLNGKEYGVPQSRERIFCIGFREPIEFKYPAPIPLKKSAFDYLETHVNHKYLLKEKGVRFITAHINHIKSYTQINGDIILCQKRNQQFNWHGDFVYHPIPSGYSERLYPESIFDIKDFDESYFVEKSNGLYAINFDKNGDIIMLNHSELPVEEGVGYYRKLTPRECLRLMGFDDSFKIVVSDTATYKQSGNSIIVDVFMALLKKIDITKYGI
jgi:DNA (cytosine-5)-methyltransferase 1